MLTCQKWRAGRALWLRLSWLERKLRRGCTDLDCTFGRWCSGWLLLQELNQSPLGLPARCGESGVNLEQRVIRFFFVKNKITLRSMQLYLVPPSYGRSGAQGWYSTGWKIKLLFSLLFLLSTYLIGVPIFPNTLNLSVVICNEDLSISKWQWCWWKTVLLATLTPFWNTF